MDNQKGLIIYYFWIWGETISGEDEKMKLDW